jgi:hypothetical protein
MKNTFYRSSVVSIALAFALVFAAGVFAAASNYSLFGDAELKSPGNSSPTAAQIRSSATVAPNYGGVNFVVPDGLTVGDLDTLSVEYKFTAGECAAGSPRFQINVSDGTVEHNIFVYLGSAEHPNDCGGTSWIPTGNLVDLTDVVDSTQLPGGGYQQSWSDVQNLYGTYEVTGIQFVTDSYYAVAGGIQTVLADNVRINNTTFSFESANSCKNGGWQNFASAPGPFSNQGQCVSYFAKGGQ